MNIRTTIAATISAASALTALAGPAPAAADPLDAWVKTVSKKVTANLDQAATGGHGAAAAIVRRTGDGRAELVRMDCDKRSVARAARIAIARLRKLPPLPAGFEKQPIRIQVLLGDPGDTYGYYAHLKRMTDQGDRQNRMLAARVAGTRLAMAEPR